MSKTFIALDVGEKRIGVAIANSDVKIAVPLETITVDGDEVVQITQLIDSQRADVLVVGYPRNQAGLPTAQTQTVIDFARQFEHLDIKLVFQDESLTSVQAETALQKSARSYDKKDIDARAAALILQDYLEVNY